MPSLPQQAIPAALVVVCVIRTDKKLAVLKITNEGATPLRYSDKQGSYGDVIPPNFGSVAYHWTDGDRPPNTFYVYGILANTFSVYYVPRDKTHLVDC